MTHITIQIPALISRKPRGAEPLANVAFALFDIVRRVGAAVLRGLRSRHLLVQAPTHASGAEIPCTECIGGIKR